MDQEKIAEVLRDFVNEANQRKYTNNTLVRDPLVTWSDAASAMSELASIAGIDAAGPEPEPEPEPAPEPPVLPPVDDGLSGEGFI